MEPSEFVKKYNHYVDVVLDPKKFAEDLFLEDATFTIGNFPTATNHEQIAAGAQSVYNITKKLKHETTRLHVINDSCFISEGFVTYTIGDNVLDPIPLMSLFEVVMTGEGERKIKNYRAYLNIDALFVAIGMDVTTGEDGKPTYAPRK